MSVWQSCLSALDGKSKTRLDLRPSRAQTRRHSPGQKSSGEADSDKGHAWSSRVAKESALEGASGNLFSFSLTCTPHAAFCSGSCHPFTTQAHGKQPSAGRKNTSQAQSQKETIPLSSSAIESSIRENCVRTQHPFHLFCGQLWNCQPNSILQSPPVCKRRSAPLCHVKSKLPTF